MRLCNAASEARTQFALIRNKKSLCRGKRGTARLTMVNGKLFKGVRVAAARLFDTCANLLP